MSVQITKQSDRTQKAKYLNTKYKINAQSRWGFPRTRLQNQPYYLPGICYLFSGFVS